MVLEERVHRLSDPTFVSDQYKNAENLHARFDLHERFSTNKYGWPRWVFDRINLPSESRILDVGCGPGFLWVKNIDRIPEGWDITLADLSPGMVREARKNLSNGPRGFRFEVVDVRSIPIGDETFDAVIANHMLYHVPDRPKAFSEISRVLKPGGYFYATTNGCESNRELREWVKQVAPKAYGVPEVGFSLETGWPEVSQWFSNVEQHRYEDSLAITEVEPLVAYVRSGKRLSKDELKEFERFIERQIALHSVIHITKAPGIFKAQKPTPRTGKW